MAKLGDAGWTRRADLAELTQVLGAEHLRWVGGCVRDALLDVEASDIDCATTHHPEEVMRRCKQAGLRAIPTGIDHGTVTLALSQGPVEVTTLRRDVATDGRRAMVAFASNWHEDAARRDFTINALYAHPETHEISDYFGGLADLEARRVRFIGEAKARIGEDHLRILRYFRFAARFGADWDEEAVAACAALAATLKGLSRERVAMELLAICALPDPHDAFAKMHALGVLEVALPEATHHQLDALARLIAAEHAQGVEAAPIRRLAALLPPSPPVAESVAARLRLSKAQRARLISAAERTSSDHLDARALAYHVGRESALDRLLLLGDGEEVGAIRQWEPPEFPLKGGAIVARGIQAGPEVTRILQEVERRWIAEGFPDAARIEQMLRDALG